MPIRNLQRADIAMSGIVLIWGFNFIVMKDGVDNVEPVTFTALRFLVGLPFMLAIAWRIDLLRHLTWRDMAQIAAIMAVGSIGYQILLASGLKRTTSTNAALLIATMPTWTALVSISLRQVEVNRRLLAGIGMSLCGVGLVVLSQSEEGISLTDDTLTGSATMLGAAVIAAATSIINKPVIDRTGGIPFGVWAYIVTALGLGLLRAPELLTLTAADVPTSKIPNVLYTGIPVGTLGFIVWHFALEEIGPTRAATYHNFTPIVAAIAGIALLGDPLTASLVAGGALTLGGVMIVRQNTYKRSTAIRGQPLQDQRR